MSSAEFHQPDGMMGVILDFFYQGLGQSEVSKFINEFHRKVFRMLIPFSISSWETVSRCHSEALAEESI